MIEFYPHCSLKNEYWDLIKILQEKIKTKTDVYNYLCDGFYIEKSLFPENKVLEEYYSNIFKIFLKEYFTYKRIKLSENIVVEKIKNRDPSNRLDGKSKNISMFENFIHKNPDNCFITITISIPIIKDPNVFIGLRNNQDLEIWTRSIADNRGVFTSKKE